MLGKTHAVVGVTTGLLIMQPVSATELVLGTAASLIGAVISDIDVGSSGSHRDAGKMIALMVSAVVAVGVIDHIWHIGIFNHMCVWHAEQTPYFYAFLPGNGTSERMSVAVSAIDCGILCSGFPKSSDAGLF